jgi:hypothetical protein
MFLLPSLSGLAADVGVLYVACTSWPTHTSTHTLTTTPTLQSTPNNTSTFAATAASNMEYDGYDYDYEAPPLLLLELETTKGHVGGDDSTDDEDANTAFTAGGLYDGHGNAWLGHDYDYVGSIDIDNIRTMDNPHRE